MFLAFSPCVVVSGRVSIWESSSGRCVHSLEGPGESVEWVAWHPRGDVILAGSEDFTAWMWNAQSGDMMQVSCLLGSAYVSGLCSSMSLALATELGMFTIPRNEIACSSGGLLQSTCGHTQQHLVQYSTGPCSLVSCFANSQIALLKSQTKTDRTHQWPQHSLDSREWPALQP